MPQKSGVQLEKLHKTQLYCSKTTQKSVVWSRNTRKTSKNQFFSSKKSLERGAVVVVNSGFTTTGTVNLTILVNSKNSLWASFICIKMMNFLVKIISLVNSANRLWVSATDLRIFRECVGLWLWSLPRLYYALLRVLYLWRTATRIFAILMKLRPRNADFKDFGEIRFSAKSRLKYIALQRGFSEYFATKRGLSRYWLRGTCLSGYSQRPTHFFGV